MLPASGACGASPPWALPSARDGRRRRALLVAGSPSRGVFAVHWAADGPTIPAPGRFLPLASHIWATAAVVALLFGLSCDPAAGDCPWHRFRFYSGHESSPTTVRCKSLDRIASCRRRNPSHMVIPVEPGRGTPRAAPFSCSTGFGQFCVWPGFRHSRAMVPREPRRDARHASQLHMVPSTSGPRRLRRTAATAGLHAG